MGLTNMKKVIKTQVSISTAPKNTVTTFHVMKKIQLVVKPVLIDTLRTYGIAKALFIHVTCTKMYRNELRTG